MVKKRIVLLGDSMTESFGEECKIIKEKIQKLLVDNY